MSAGLGMVMVPCARRGQQISRWPRDVHERNYCSRACHYASGAPRRARRPGAENAGEVCRTEVYAPAARAAARFCSMACKGVASRRTFALRDKAVGRRGLTVERVAHSGPLRDT